MRKKSNFFRNKNIGTSQLPHLVGAKIIIDKTEALPSNVCLDYSALSPPSFTLNNNAPIIYILYINSPALPHIIYYKDC